MLPEKTAVRVIIVDHRGRIQLGLRNNNQLGGGKWTLLGGKPNEGEPLHTAIVREVKEETKQRLNVSELFTELQFDGWHSYIFIGTVSGRTHLDQEEIKELRWFKQKDIDKIPVAFGHREPIREFFAIVSQS